MTFAEYGTFAIGGATFPLVSATTNSLLQDADPALYYALDYFAACIEYHLGDRFEAQAALANLDVPGIIATKIPYNPEKYLKEGAQTFPLLSVYRARSKWGNVTVPKRHREGEWKLCFVLPPLTVDQVENVAPILSAIGAVLDNRTEQGFDPNVLLSSHPWTLSGIESIEFQDETYGEWEATGGLVFRAVELTLIVKERVENVSGAFGPLEGIDGQIDVASSNAATLNAVVEFDADTNP